MDSDNELIKGQELPQGNLFINSAIDAVLTTIPDGRIVSANPAACRMFGYTEKEIREGGRALLVATDDPRLPILLERRRKSGRVVGRLTFLRKDGSRFEGEVSSAIFQTPDGNVFTSMIIRDLSHRLRLSEELSASEAKFYQMFQSLPIGVTIADAQGKITDTNPAAERILGLSLDSQRQREIDGFEWKIIRPDGSLMPSEEYASVRALKEQRPVTGVEMGVYRGKDDLAWIVVNAAPFLNKGVIISYEEITERKHAEEQARRLATAVQQAGQAVLILNPARQLVYANPAAYELFHQDNLVLGTEWQFLATAREHQRAEQLWQALNEGRFWSGSFTFFIDEKPLILFLNAGPVRQADQSSEAFVITATDMTERTLWEERLIKAQRLESIGTLAAGIAHDFNNLMAGVFGFIDVAGMMSKDENVTKTLDKAKSAIERARKLTGQLLTFAKGQKANTQLMPLFPLVKDAVALALSGSKVAVEYELADPLPLCRIQPDRLTQVIENLVLNAREAMPQGGKLTVSAQNTWVGDSDAGEVPPGRYVLLVFQDQGVGIAPENLSRVFDPFYTTKPQAQGLGLTTSYSIVTQHQGFLLLQSQLGQGTKVRLFLPVQ